MSDTSGAEPARWQLPAIDGSDGRGYLTAGRLEAIQKDAYDEAWEKGHAEGFASGEQEVRSRVERLDELLTALARPFDELDEQIEKALVELSMTVVRQLFRREIGQNPTHVIGVVREAIQLLPVASRDVQVHLHPDDASIVRECLSPAEGEPAWVTIEDPLITKGGCKVTAENSTVDASVEARLKSLIAQISGDERQ